jgi:hypothetical protein
MSKSLVLQVPRVTLLENQRVPFSLVLTELVSVGPKRPRTGHGNVILMCESDLMGSILTSSRVAWDRVGLDKCEVRHCTLRGHGLANLEEDFGYLESRSVIVAMFIIAGVT